MVQSTKDTCKDKTVTALAFRDGLMVHATKDNGSITRPMGRANFGMPMATYTMERGAMTKLTVSVFTPTLMAPSTKANGSTIISTARVLNFGQTAASTTACTVMV